MKSENLQRPESREEKYQVVIAHLEEGVGQVLSLFPDVYNLPINVKSFPSLKEATKYLDENHCDLFISGLSFNGFDGHDGNCISGVYRELKNLSDIYSVNVLVASGYGFSQEENAKNNGFSYIGLPFENVEMVEAIRNELGLESRTVH